MRENFVKKIIRMLSAFLLGVVVLSGCSTQKAPLEQENDTDKFQIVCTTFPQYDWVMQLLGEAAKQFNVTLLVKNNADIHNYQPSTKDMIAMKEADLFLYVGGESDAWVEDKGLQNIAAFQTFPQFFMLAKRYSIPIEKIVRKMTGKTADRFKIPERGYLKPGYKADITVIDLDNMKVDESKPDFRPEGIVHVYVNGQPVVRDGEYKGGKNGVVVLKNKK